MDKTRHGRHGGVGAMLQQVGGGSSQHPRSAVAAASVRLVFGAMALALFPSIYPGLSDQWWAFVAYMGLAGLTQLGVMFQIGGRLRAAAMGLVDLAFLTFLIHRVGSPATVLVAAYFVVAILNTLVVTPRFGMIMALLGVTSYGGVLFAESFHLLPYGPDAPAWARGGAPPTPLEAFASWLIISSLLIVATYVTARLVRKIDEHETRLRDLSFRDPLTSLYNRRHLVDEIERELARVERGRPMTLLMIDLDGFKHINDEHGHLRGDELLKAVSRALVGETRTTDAAGRYGGDEFAVVLSDTAADEGRNVAERLGRAIAEAARPFDRERPVTASIGVAPARRGDSPRSLLRRADEASYQAKQNGGDTTVIATDTEKTGDEEVSESDRPRPSVA